MNDDTKDRFAKQSNQLYELDQKVTKFIEFTRRVQREDDIKRKRVKDELDRIDDSIKILKDHNTNNK